MKNRSKIIAALAFLISVSSAFSGELASLLSPRPGNGIGGSEIGARLTRHTVYVRKNATGASSAWKIIDENTKKVDGVSSISETKLPKNHAVVFDKISIGYAIGTAAGEEGGLTYKTAVPATLRNANLVIVQNGREVIDLPVADLIKGDSTASSEDNYHDLEGFNYLVDDQPMDWHFRFPNGESLPAVTAGDNNYVEVRLQGFKTTRKQ